MTRVRLVIGLLPLLLSACALWHSSPESAPLLRLQPAALSKELSTPQRITVSRDTPQGPQAISADAVLEVDGNSVRMAVLSLGQPMMRFEWDGQQLAQSQVPAWPEVVTGEQILNDVQLALWPGSAIRAALPAGWSLDDTPEQASAPARRWLRHDGNAVLRIDYPNGQTIAMAHLMKSGDEAWRVVIESAYALPFSPPLP